MVFNLKSRESLISDIDNKTFQDGMRLSGDVKGEKVSLYLEDSHGKHSHFACQTFYGKLSGNTLTGSFRISNFALVMLIILTVLAVENLVTSFIFSGISGVTLSVTIIIVEIIYLFALNKLSFEQNQIIKEYLESI